MNKKAMIALMGLAAAGMAGAATVDVTADIETSTKWVSTNVYNLTKQIYVRPGATLTIEAGTRVESTANVGGSLAVSRGARIYVNGTKDAPVVMTSSNDDGTARVACNEWGNLTLMGKGLIAASSDLSRNRPGNTKTPTGLNTVQMEGLVADGTNDVVYGGADDNDDSGSISYLSLRYGGKVIGLGNELNGLSLGGIGRETDINHVEIFNNVDDGIEIWGGAVNLKYVNIWNIGDDSFDIDQGWRGKAQFGLIVQGYSATAKQGSGYGDNCFEHDGAENSDASPVTSGKIANFTVVGQPKVSGYKNGDGATTWRDNARIQYANMIFMDIGEEIVRLDGIDGDGAQGYSLALTGVAPEIDGEGDLTATGKAQEEAAFVPLWSTPYNTYYETNFVDDVYSYAEMYQAQTSGYLCEIRNSVMFRNADDSGDLADTVGVYSPAMNNTVASSNDMPIANLTRGIPATFTVGEDNYIVLPVASIDPRAANDATDVGAGVEGDDFFTSVNYAGGFSPNYNWLEGWTAVDEFGLTDVSANTNAPTSDLAIGAVVSFQSEQGVLYGVERAAAAGGPYSEVASISGDGSYKTYVDDELSTAAFYRVVVK